MKDERKKLYKTLIEMNDVKIALIAINRLINIKKNIVIFSD